MERHHTIDSRGEVVLVIKNPNAPFAVWPQDAQPTGMPKSHAENDTARPNEVRIQVSAKHLAHCSPVFDRIFNGFPNEFSDKGSIQLVVDSWDVDAFLMLAQICIIADYYDIQEVKFFADMWMEYMPHLLPAYSRDLMLSFWLRTSSTGKLCLRPARVLPYEQARVPSPRLVCRFQRAL
ncbi:hypothetical protein BDW62DRAFT_204687 [Aspergillus aurantiobrunneus]